MEGDLLTMFSAYTGFLVGERVDLPRGSGGRCEDGEKDVRGLGAVSPESGHAGAPGRRDSLPWLIPVPRNFLALPAPSPQYWNFKVCSQHILQVWVGCSQSHQLTQCESPVCCRRGASPALQLLEVAWNEGGQ